VKLKLSIALNIVLIAVAVTFLARGGLQKLSRSVVDRYPPKRFEAFEVPSMQQVPQKFDYRFDGKPNPTNPTSATVTPPARQEARQP